MELLKTLCETPAIPGRESALIEVMLRELKRSCDEVRVDGMGNVVGRKRGRKKGGRRIMLAGHMDEIGFIVSHIDKSGSGEAPSARCRSPRATATRPTR